MSGKTQMSLKTKKILTGIGIVFGTVVVFSVSFILAFSLIVNPINFFTVSDASMVEENEKLKKEVQDLTDKNEILEATADKYKAAANAPQPSVPAVVTTPVSSTDSNSGSGTAGSNSTGSADKTENAQKPETGSEETPSSTTETEPESGNAVTDAEEVFSPSTVDSTAEQTPEDVEIPIIDISE